jgi:hypothetical protein
VVLILFLYVPLTAYNPPTFLNSLSETLEVMEVVRMGDGVVVGKNILVACSPLRLTQQKALAVQGSETDNFDLVTVEGTARVREVPLVVGGTPQVVIFPFENDKGVEVAAVDGMWMVTDGDDCVVGLTVGELPKQVEDS